MNETTKCNREERIAQMKEYLREAGAAKALLQMQKRNQHEKNEHDEESLEFMDSCNHGLCVTLLMAAEADAEELLHDFTHLPLEVAILHCHTLILAAGISEPVLNHYLRQLLVHLFGWCDEIDDMIETLKELYERRGEMPVECSQEFLDSWWVD